VAALSRLVAEAAGQGDPQAQAIIDAAAVELAALVDAVRGSLGITADTEVAVSRTGGLFGVDGPLSEPFERALAARSSAYLLSPPRLLPVLGAALYAARSAGTLLTAAALARLADAQ
jgi:N-acetylglucosamine kinase-like BadF-type ATPase